MHIVFYAMDGSNGLYNVSGNGAPTLYAGKGSIYHRRDGGAGTSLYVKESDSGSNTWVAK